MVLVALNAPAHRSTLITEVLTKNDILTINYCPYSPYLFLCVLYLFAKLHLAMKGKCYTDIEDIQRSTDKISKKAKRWIEYILNKINQLCQKMFSCLGNFATDLVDFVWSQRFDLFSEGSISAVFINNQDWTMSCEILCQVVVKTMCYNIKIYVLIHIESLKYESKHYLL